MTPMTPRKPKRRAALFISHLNDRVQPQNPANEGRWSPSAATDKRVISWNRILLLATSVASQAYQGHPHSLTEKTLDLLDLHFLEARSTLTRSFARPSCTPAQPRVEDFPAALWVLATCVPRK